MGTYYATDEGGLHDYQTGKWLREATPGEIGEDELELERSLGA